ncbi:coproporphyrinogen dehydrogenase HemZ [Selenomonas sp. oral taxon 138]|uniref:coproporphyrinogen dehydrogenase HemZ n=1 Tax=Selenomonas sp. oral taxon 138 TaxID=712532 RepID=UPI0002A46DA3|nr:coproporphyrinogen dehydrogenase HemZ [Selenomonas sp. oral taxon 138]EKX95215.1 coproporphyrinogen dehydrogenase HemZ [Selenomonas sp. oral taxon 138 str. F0429]
MKIRSLTINTRTEVIVKIVREVLTLFKAEIVGRAGEADYAQLSVVNRQLGCEPPSVMTEVFLFALDGSCERFECSSDGAADEVPRAAVHRTIKRNVYAFFRTRFQLPPAPWGILHGVRPTKIVHRWLRGGISPEAVIARLQTDYECSAGKARLITAVAVRQLPFLAQNDVRRVSIYVGIPFCLSRCLYCSFPSNLLPGREKIRSFMDVLARDLAAAAEDVRALGLTIESIYIGGGTPTSLPNDFFAEMLKMVYNAFYGSTIAEFTVEAGRPDSMSAEKIAAMKTYAVTRVSVNPQSMQAETLRRIGRHHTPEDIVCMVREIRAAFDVHINMDVILGLPGETAEDVGQTMAQVTALAPDDITLHALALKRGSNLRLKMESEHVELPSDAETQRMSEAAVHAVEEAGYRPYYLYRQGYMSGDLENVGYARAGAESIYNIQIMEERQTIIGIGGAATTKVLGVRSGRMHSVFHAKDLVTYLRDIDIYIEKRRALLRAEYEEETP